MSSPFLKISVLFFTLAIAGAVLAIFKLNIFTIKKIDIESTNVACADENQLKTSSNLLGRNFFMVNFSKTENDLKKKFYCIKSVAVSKFLPDKIRLKVSNREALLVLADLINEASFSATPSAQDVKDYYLIDNEGVLFDKGDNNLNIPQIFIYDPKISLGLKLTGEAVNIIKILEKMKILGVQIKKGFIKDGIFVVSSDPSVSGIIFRLSENIDIQLASLQLILDKAKIDSRKLEFIDLRFDKPVVKFAPKKS